MDDLDDILNGSDSDDDIVCENIDLEGILDEDDGEISSPTISITKHSDVAGASSSSSSSSSFLLNPSISAKDSSLKHDSIENLLDDEDEVEPSTLQSPLGDIDVPFNSEEDNDELSALFSAEAKEKKFLSLGNREFIKILSAGEPSSGVSTSCIHMWKLNTISHQLKRNFEYKQHGPGRATVLWSGSKFYAIGTSRGLILVFGIDENVRQILGSSIQGSTQTLAAISAIDVSSQGHFLFSGNSVGEISMWDVGKGVLIKKITEVHAHRIIKLDLAFSFQDSSLNNQSQMSSKLGMKMFSSFGGKATSSASTVDDFSELLSSDNAPAHLTLLSVDNNGVVSRIKFSKMLWSSFSSETDCLLDGSAGAVLDIRNLKPFTGKSSISNSITRYPALNQFAALGTEKRTIVIQIHPSVRILHKWNSSLVTNNNTSASTSSLPSFLCLDWGWKYENVGLANSSSVVANPVLYRLQGNLIEAMIMKYEDSPGHVDEIKSYSFFTIASQTFNFHCLSMRVISESQIMVLGIQGLYILNSMLEIVDNVAHSWIPANLIEDSRWMTYGLSNVSSVQQKTIYCLSEENVMCCQLQDWKEKMDTFISQGKWLESLSILLEHYEPPATSMKSGDGAVSSISVSVSSREWNDLLTSKLKKYLELALSSSSLASTSSSSSSLTGSKGIPGTNSHHYQLVASVCVEICSTTHRTDLLFEDIYTMFASNGQAWVFFEALEPYILQRLLTNLPPNLIRDFADVSIRYHRMPSFERCLVHLDAHEMDLNFALKFSRDHAMWSAFLYIYSSGMKDYGAAWNLVFQCMKAADKLNHKNDSQHNNNLDLNIFQWIPSSRQIEIGYQLLLFFKYAIENRIFPRGESLTIPLASLQSLLTTILSPRWIELAGGWIEVNSTDSGTSLTSSTNSSSGSMLPATAFPYLLGMSKIDLPALLSLCCQALKRIQVETNTVEEQKTIENGYFSIFQFCKNTLANEALFSGGDLDSNSIPAVEMFFRYAEVGLSTSSFHWDKEMLLAFVFYLKKRYAVTHREEGEKLAMQLVQNQLQRCSSSSIGEVVDAMEKGQFWRAALEGYGSSIAIRKSPSFWNHFAHLAVEGVKYYVNYTSPSNSIVVDSSNIPVFSYIDTTFHHLQKWQVNESSMESSKVDSSFQSSSSGTSTNTSTNATMEMNAVEVEQIFLKALVNVIPTLGGLNLEQTLALANSKLLRYFSDVLNKLGSVPPLQYSIAHSMIESALSERPLEFAEIFSADDIFRYLKLLLVHAPTSMYAFVSSCDHYPLDASIKLLTDNKILDGLSVLVERTGEVDRALTLLLHELSLRLHRAKIYVDRCLQGNKNDSNVGVDSNDIEEEKGIVASPAVQASDRYVLLDILSHASMSSVDLVSRLSFYGDIDHIIECIISLCRRHSSNRVSTTLLLTACDSLLRERNNLISMSSTGEILRVLLGVCIQNLISSMTDVVSTQEVMKKILQDYSYGSKYREFKDILHRILNTYQLDQQFSSSLLSITSKEAMDLRKRVHWKKRRGVRTIPSQEDEIQLAMSTTSKSISTSEIITENSSSMYPRSCSSIRTHSILQRKIEYSAQPLELLLSPPPLRVDFGEE